MSLKKVFIQAILMEIHKLEMQSFRFNGITEIILPSFWVLIMINDI